PPGLGQRAQNVGRPAAGGDADDHVPGPDAGLGHVLLAVLAAVLRLFAGAAEGPVAPGDDPLHLLWGHPKGRRALRRVQDSQPSARPRTDVKEPPPLGKGLYDHLDSLLDFGDLTPYSFRHAGILLVDDLQDLPGAPGVEIGIGRTSFGHQLI